MIELDPPESEPYPMLTGYNGDPCMTYVSEDPRDPHYDEHLWVEVDHSHPVQVEFQNQILGTCYGLSDPTLNVLNRFCNRFKGSRFYFSLSGKQLCIDIAVFEATLPGQANVVKRVRRYLTELPDSKALERWLSEIAPARQSVQRRIPYDHQSF